MDVRKSRTTFSPDYLLRFHDRFSDTPGNCEVIWEGKPASGTRSGDLVERYPDGFEGVVISVKTTIHQLVSLAKEAPMIRPGPKT